MNKTQILEHLATDPKYLEMCRFITHDNAGLYADDLFQDLLVYLCEMPEEKLVKLRPKLSDYFFMMALHQYQSKTSAFFYTHKKPSQFVEKNHYDIMLMMSQDKDLNQSLTYLRQAMSELSFVDTKLLELSAERATIKQVALDSGIPRRSVYKLIQDAKESVRAKVRRYKRIQK